jgi:N,N'-diacetyllegionaminate synthase
VSSFSIGGRRVGRGEPCYVIAEAGVNHDGNVEDARELVRAAHAAGVDAVKFQLFNAAELVTANAAKARYQTETTDPAESQRDMLAQLELPEDVFSSLAALAAQLGVAFLCTAYSERTLDVLAELGVPAFKFASAQIVEPAMLAHAASFGRPLLVSTGMSTLGEIDAALGVVRANGNPPVALLQCTTEYPAPIEDANLKAIPALAERFGVSVGYSDHTAGETAAVAAVALGAVIVEKHLTLDRSRAGPDHASSLEPDAFARFVRALRDAEAALGSSERAPTERERDNAFSMRRSLHAATDIAAGATIAREQIALRRPADGLPPADLERVVGAKAAVDIERDAPLTEANVTL